MATEFSSAFRPAFSPFVARHIGPDGAQQRRLEALRRQLRAYVQPRLAWEVALLELSGAV